jgi:DNA integrity scanning protein DisA with diadenylate cyclase activity
VGLEIVRTFEDGLLVAVERMGFEKCGAIFVMEVGA